MISAFKLGPGSGAAFLQRRSPLTRVSFEGELKVKLNWLCRIVGVQDTRAVLPCLGKERLHVDPLCHFSKPNWDVAYVFPESSSLTLRQIRDR